MKKELLMGTALVSTLGAASVAEAVTATMSGNHQTGIEFDSPSGGTDTNDQTQDNNFTVSLSETTDGVWLFLQALCLWMKLVEDHLMKMLVSL